MGGRTLSPDHSAEPVTAFVALIGGDARSTNASLDTPSISSITFYIAPKRSSLEAYLISATHSLRSPSRQWRAKFVRLHLLILAVLFFGNIVLALAIMAAIVHFARPR